MAKETKHTATAYLRALAGAVFGLLGLHRYYLGFPVSGTLLSVIFLGGVVCMVMGYIEVFEQILGGYSLLLSGGTDVARFSSSSPVGVGPLFRGGMAASVAGIIWFLIDLATMPLLTRKANRGTE